MRKKKTRYSPIPHLLQEFCNSVEKSTRAVYGIAKKLGGMIYDQRFEATEVDPSELKISTDSIMLVTAYKPQSEIAGRVPSENLEEFMYDVALDTLPDTLTFTNSFISDYQLPINKRLGNALADGWSISWFLSQRLLIFGRSF